MSESTIDAALSEVAPEPGMEPRTVLIPGGAAVLRDPRTLTVGQKRPMQIVQARLGKRFQQIVTAQAILPPPNAELTDEQWADAAEEAGAAMETLQLTEQEYELLFRLNDAAMYAIIQSWTLVDDDGLALPLPRNVDEVALMRDDVYTVLSLHVASMQATFMAENGFGLDSIEVPDSPTGASAGSSPSSVGAPQPTSTSTPLPDSASTGTDG